MNRQARFKEAPGWCSFGAIGWIEAAQELCENESFDDDWEHEVEVREEDNPALVRTFTMRRKSTWECLNPRQGA